MSTTTETLTVPSDDTTTAPGLSGRLGALAVLGITAAGLLWAAHAGYRAATDAWVAPLRLSPQSDAVIQVRQRMTREDGERARLEAEVARFDAELAAMASALERLGNLRTSATAAMKWQASVHAGEAGSYQAVLDTLRRQRDQLQALHRSQLQITTRAEEDLKAGLIDRHEFTRHEQALRSTAAALADNERLIEENEQRRQVASSSSRAYRAKLRGEVVPASGAASKGELPQVMQLQENDIRLELELQKLDAEQRSLRQLRAAAQEALDKQRVLLEELKAKPLYRAVAATIDLAFVPYEQLPGVAPGARVIACEFAVFRCRDVGQVTEIVPGEVVAEGASRELTRGVYVMLKLDDPEAVREKLLRLRKS